MNSIRKLLVYHTTTVHIIAAYIRDDDANGDDNGDNNKYDKTDHGAGIC